MLEFLSAFAEFFNNVIEFIITFFTNVVEICVLVFKGFAYASAVIAYLPLQYQLILFALISYSVIVAVLHFGG